MTRICIEGKHIKRNVCMEFDINTKISYENFCADKNYQKLVNDAIENDDRIKEIYWLLMSSRENNKRISEHIKNKILFLFEYDLEESFSNGLEFRYIDRFFTNKKKVQGWFQDKNLNKGIDVIKYCLTNNYFIGDPQKRKKSISFSPKLFNPNLVYKVEVLGGRKHYLEIKDEIKNQITLSQQIKKNKRIDYITFMTLLSVKNLYLVADDNIDNLFIVDEENLKNQLSTISFVWNISGYLNEITDKETWVAIEKLRNIYKRDDVPLENMLKDLKELINKTGTLKISIDIQNKEPVRMKGNFKTSDFTKFWELKDYIEGNGHVASDENNGRKTRIVWEKRFTYQKSWNSGKKK